MWKVIGVIVLLVAIIGGISRCVANPERGDSGEVVGAGTEAVLDIRQGDCLPKFMSDTSTLVSEDVPVVPCSDPHVYEVFGVADSTAESFNQSAIGTEADNYCLDAFTSYVGVNYDNSTLVFSSLVPTSSSWGQGDREITCLLANSDETTVTGSYKGSGK
jgi:hypothetical protein